MAGDSKQMPKLDLQRDSIKLSQPQLDYMRIVENQNLERVQKLARMKRNNIWVGSMLGLGVLGIYGYSIYSVKQEKFLDELD
ncbi:cytochrome c oxidase assembly factor 3, mitochondrial-like [Homarus americanus]|uniref:Cytochrome c oxidase assembly factor 3 n=1 Tax=Homarus americanus TaxID=6706 RepID=A0A8J5K1R2_HOMAM|nr:cytochrome c oxidase assembly factor 3, mitochondrial-like [Homarus americanus]KAG7167967.1 Cytochrome c oxidase assembly factor 3-like [Homarus americanus]